MTDEIISNPIQEGDLNPRLINYLGNNTYNVGDKITITNINGDANNTKTFEILVNSIDNAIGYHGVILQEVQTDNQGSIIQRLDTTYWQDGSKGVNNLNPINLFKNPINYGIDCWESLVDWAVNDFLQIGSGNITKQAIAGKTVIDNYLNNPNNIINNAIGSSLAANSLACIGASSNPKYDNIIFDLYSGGLTDAQVTAVNNMWGLRSDLSKINIHLTPYEPLTMLTGLADGQTINSFVNNRSFFVKFFRNLC